MLSAEVDRLSTIQSLETCAAGIGQIQQCSIRQMSAEATDFDEVWKNFKQKLSCRLVRHIERKKKEDTEA